MSEIHYTVQDWQQVPEELDWLTTGERVRYDGFRFEKRRRDWLLGRWTAKIALLGVAGLSENEIGRIEIASAPDGAPLPRLDGRPYRVSLSLSHSNNRAFAVVARLMSPLGCDIELVEPRSAGFVETYFTSAERERVERAEPQFRDLLVTIIWSAKESTLKAQRTGLHVDTRSVEVIDGSDIWGAGWQTARAISADAGEFHCQWRRDGRFVLTVATRTNSKPLGRSGFGGVITAPGKNRVAASPLA